MKILNKYLKYIIFICWWCTENEFSVLHFLPIEMMLGIFITSHVYLQSNENCPKSLTEPEPTFAMLLFFN